MRLGHAPGRFCPSFKDGNKDFVVIHMNGIHTIHLEFCRCKGVPWHVQLLRAGWYPATPLKPWICATMEVLKTFHILNLQGKMTGYSFYQSLKYLTDSTGLYPTPVRAPTISNCWLSLTSHLTGSSRRIYVNGARMAPPEDVKTCWPCV